MIVIPRKNKRGILRCRKCCPICNAISIAKRKVSFFTFDTFCCSERKVVSGKANDSCKTPTIVTQIGGG